MAAAKVCNVFICHHMIRTNFNLVSSECKHQVTGQKTGFSSEKLFNSWYRCACWWNSLRLCREACALHTWNCSTRWRLFHLNSERAVSRLWGKWPTITESTPMFREQEDLKFQRACLRKSIAALYFDRGLRHLLTRASNLQREPILY